MCGIIGFVDKNRSSINFSNAMKKRGPDYQGIESLESAIFGHALLAIQGVNPVKQPLRGDNSLLVFNGEIYNWSQLSHEYNIECDDSDSLLLMELIRLLGFHEAVSKIMGMFAIAYYCGETKKVYLARDYFGEKPLYYKINNHGEFAFSSLASDLGSKDDLNQKWFEDFIIYGYSLESDTPFNGVVELPRNSILVYCCETKTKNILAIRISNNDTSEIKPNDIINLISGASVPFCTLLSGGIDSTYINLVLAKHKKFKSYTLTFSDTTSEGEVARSTSRKLGIENEQHQFDFDHLILKKAIESLDIPIGDPSFFPTWMIYKELSKEFRLSLSGDGGDELYFGYKRHRLPFLIWFLIRLSTPHVVSIRLQGYKKYLPRRLRFLLEANIKGFYLSIVSQGCSNAEAEGKFSNNFSTELEGLIKLEGDYFLQKYVLRKVDIASMANSVENRSPFLSHWLHVDRLFTPRVYFATWRKLPLRKAVKHLLGWNAYFKKGFTPNIGGLIGDMSRNEPTVFDFDSKYTLHIYRKNIINLWLQAIEK